jgi:hypothetical protein
MEESTRTFSHIITRLIREERRLTGEKDQMDALLARGSAEIARKSPASGVENRGTSAPIVPRRKRSVPPAGFLGFSARSSSFSYTNTLYCHI